MPRKSTTGKSPRNKEQAAVSAPVVPDGNPVSGQAGPAEVQPEVKAAAEPRKFELHKNEAFKNDGLKNEAPKAEAAKADGRNNVVPINVEEEIRRRAYELFQQRGMKSGSEAEDWLAAEHEVMQRYRQQQRA
jgi:hypothetical protein